MTELLKNFVKEFPRIQAKTTIGSIRAGGRSLFDVVEGVVRVSVERVGDMQIQRLWSHKFNPSQPNNWSAYCAALLPEVVDFIALFRTFSLPLFLV